MAKIFLLVFIVGFLALKVKSFDDDEGDFSVAKRGAESDGDDDDGVLRSSRTRSCTNPPNVACAILRRSSSSRSRPFFTSQRSRTQYPHGRRAYYHLRDNRYTLRGATRIRCINGRWTRGPTCRRQSAVISCSTPRISCGTCRGNGARARCKANEGWELVGRQTATCRRGRWRLPKCRATCSTPRISCGTCTKRGSTATCTARPGWKLAGSATARCTNGTWSLPTCQETTLACPSPIISCGTCRIRDSTATCTANSGWKLSGSTTATCSNGEWRFLPTCEPQAQCPDPKIDCGTCVRQGGSAVCTANAGWDLVGSASRTCQSDGTWSGDPPQCREMECSNPPHVSCANCRTNPPWARSSGRRVRTTADVARNRRRFSRSFKQGRKVYYHVKEGWTLRGDVAVECKKGQWTPPPRCLGGGSPETTTPTTTTTTTTTTTLPTSTTKKNRGNAVQRRCGNPPHVPCGECVTVNPNSRSQRRRSRRVADSVDVYRNRRRAMVFSPGRTVYYKLKDGDWTLKGNISVTCQSDGTWSKPPECDRPYCDGLPQLGNGTCSSTDSEGVKMTEKASCRCNNGFSLLGFNQVTCRNATNSIWGNKPSCAPISGPGCRRAPRIRNGRCNRITAPAFPFEKYLKANDFVNCECRTGYGINIGSAKYRPEDLIQFRPIIHQGDNYGDAFIKATTVGKCIGQNRFKDLPKCERLPKLSRPCPFPPEVQGSTCHKCTMHGQQNITFYPGDTVRYQCGGSYRIRGNPIIKCRNNGQWSREPECIEIPQPSKCRNIPKPLNGFCQAIEQVDCDDCVFAGMEVECKCENGYQLDGDPIIFCDSNGTWSSTGPTCTFKVEEMPPKCSLDDINNAIINGACESAAFDGAFEFIQGENVECFCDDGTFELQGPRLVACNGSEGWSSNRPTCRRLGNCGEIFLLANGYCWSNTNYGTIFKEGDEMQCACDSGFVISENAANERLIRCQADNTWEAVPTCNRV